MKHGSIARSWIWSLATACLLAAPPAGAGGEKLAVAAGDVLQVSVLAGGSKQEDFTVAVSPAGSLVAPLLGEVVVAGQTTDHIADALRTAYARGFYVNPTVIVAVKEYAAKIYVSGEVVRPGAYPFQSGLTLLNACVTAGGLTTFAAPGKVRVIHASDGGTRVVQVDLARVRKGTLPDVPLNPGDHIEVPARRF